MVNPYNPDNAEAVQRCANKIAAFTEQMAVDEPEVTTAELYSLFLLNVLAGAQTLGMPKSQVRQDVEILWDAARAAMQLFKKMQ